jgi:hypothetical protein
MISIPSRTLPSPSSASIAHWKSWYAYDASRCRFIIFLMPFRCVTTRSRTSVPASMANKFEGIGVRIDIQLRELKTIEELMGKGDRLCSCTAVGIKYDGFSASGFLGIENYDVNRHSPPSRLKSLLCMPTSDLNNVLYKWT